MRAQVTEILEDKSTLLTEQYFKLQQLFEEKYGKDTVVLMEVGTFFETYEVNNDEEQIGKAKEVAELLNIQLTRKNKTILENSQTNPLMAGVPAISFEKHINRIIQEQKYTVVIIKQIGVPPKVKRTLDAIISPADKLRFCGKQRREQYHIHRYRPDKGKLPGWVQRHRRNDREMLL